MRKIITSKNAPAPIGPYSHGVLMGNTLFVSGQVGKHPVSGELMLSDIKTETRQVMENLKGILADAGMDFSNVCKTTIFLTDMNDFASVNEIYGSYLDGQAGFPARETVQVTKLPLNVNVEISMIAIK
jgi:2-iminobutanoate/2-iminopropanoate deaminase